MYLPIFALQVRNQELHYAAITFMVEEEPAQLGRMLTVRVFFCY
jgi:hypothetical protein